MHTHFFVFSASLWGTNENVSFSFDDTSSQRLTISGNQWTIQMEFWQFIFHVSAHTSLNNANAYGAFRVAFPDATMTHMFSHFFFLIKIFRSAVIMKQNYSVCRPKNQTQHPTQKVTVMSWHKLAAIEYLSIEKKSWWYKIVGINQSFCYKPDGDFLVLFPFSTWIADASHDDCMTFAFFSTLTQALFAISCCDRSGGCDGGGEWLPQDYYKCGYTWTEYWN